MTVIDVDTDVYTNSGRALVTAAEAWFRAVDAKWSTLAGCGQMCGSYSEAVSWAQSYDTRADELIRGTRQVAEAADNYARILIELGHNHAIGDYFATIGAGGQPPTAPTMPDPAIFVCKAPLPAAGGPGQGLVDGAIGLVEKVGIVIPDGDTSKLKTAADAWTQLAAAPEVTGFVAELERIAGLFAPITAPELDHVDEDLRALRAAAADVVTGFGELAASTTEHRDALAEMRDKIAGFLDQLAKETAIEIAISATITIAASLVTFGAAAAGGAAIAAGRVAHIVARYGPKIRPLVEVFKLRGLGRGFSAVPDFSRHRQEMQRLLDLGAKNRARPKPTSWVSDLTARDRHVLELGPADSRSNNLTELLRRGDPLTPEQQRYVDDLNAALSKLPAHEGPVLRHTNLTPEQLARYEPGKPTTELGFTSTSNKPSGVDDVFVQNAKVEMQIISKNGRVYGEYGTPDEVLFPSNTEFFVHNKFRDPATGRIIIQMSEI